jgi:hypothetical protein
VQKAGSCSSKASLLWPQNLKEGQASHMAAVRATVRAAGAAVSAASRQKPAVLVVVRCARSQPHPNARACSYSYSIHLVITVMKPFARQHFFSQLTSPVLTNPLPFEVLRQYRGSLPSHGRPNIPLLWPLLSSPWLAVVHTCFLDCCTDVLTTQRCAVRPLRLTHTRLSSP